MSNSKEKVPTVMGIVTEALPNTMFKVRTQVDGQEKELLAHLSGKMRLNRIRVLIGDRVSLEIDPYGGNSNRITKRL
jgi:translation initiation factor IF-1